MDNPTRGRSVGIAVVLFVVLAAPWGWRAFAAGSTEAGQATSLTPVVVFPAFHFTKLSVQVVGQTAFPECPGSGHFEDWYLNPQPTQLFGQECRDKLLTLVYDPDPGKPFSQRFSDQPGVKVTIKNYGTTASAPFYEPLYQFLEANGYERDVNVRVAGYDSRLTPDMRGFLARTVDLIEDTYRRNGNTPVHLVGHSNGPLYAQYLLTHTSQAWKDQHIHGFTPLAGNWPGQGLLYPVYFTGLNIVDFGLPATPGNAASSATMYLSHPSSYMSSADPAIFGDVEIVVRSIQSGIEYTPEDHQALFGDAGLPLAQLFAQQYVGFVKFATPAFFPNVDVYAEKGSGFETTVGLELDDLTVGQVYDGTNGAFARPDGDFNQEDITNDSIQVWEDMDCFHFELNDNPGVDHFALPSDPTVLARLLAHLSQARSVCP